jgi:hypothetical protein
MKKRSTTSGIAIRTLLVVGTALGSGVALAAAADGSTADWITTSYASVSRSVADPPTRAASSSEPSDALGGTTTSWVEVTAYDQQTGEVLAHKRLGSRTEGKVLSPLHSMRAERGNGTGGTSSASGCTKVEIWQKRTTFLGAFAAKFGVWSDWCWARGGQRVTLNRRGFDMDVGPGYSWDDVQQSSGYFYDFSTNDGHPKSAYHHHKIGGFSSPGGGPIPQGHWYPKNTLDSYYNGTWQWFTSY